MRRPLLAALALVGLLVCLAMFWGYGRRRPPPRPGSGVVSLVFLDVGQGDATLIRSPEGKTALVDAGPSSRIVGQLRELGVESIDLVVVSHHHFDHYGGMAAVVREFHPRAFLDADSPHATANYLALLGLIKDEGITAIRAGPASRKVGLGSLTLVVLPQPPPDSQEENNNSVGIRVEYGGFSALLTGDSEGPERRWWMGHAPGLCADVDVLKLAHHGSRNGTNSAWLGLTRPELAVASMAHGNEFGHPHPETLGLLRSLDIATRRTDESGSIEVRTDGRTWSLEPSTSPSGAPPWAADGPPRSSGRPRREAMVRLNSSSEGELRMLPGIGPAMASRIIEGRPYRSVDDLARVPNLGKKRIEQIRPFVTAE